MAFDKNIVDYVREKYGVNMESAKKWWKHDELWHDPELTDYLGSHYDGRVVKAVKDKYGVHMDALNGGRWWEHKELFKDLEFGDYFIQLKKLGFRKIQEVLNEPRPWRSTDSIGKPRFPNFEKTPGLREVGIIPVLSDKGR